MMQRASKSGWFESVFDLYNTRLLRRHFHAVHIRHHTPLDGPVVVLSNHTSWWDGLVLFHLNRHLWHRDAYVLMGQDGLRQYPFFRRLGAFSVNPLDPFDVHRGLRYAMGVLERDNGLLAWFPQGEERHQDRRPLAFMNGLPTLVRILHRQHPNVRILPMGMRYEFLEHERPEVFVSFGRPTTIASLIQETGFSLPPIKAALETQVTSILDDMQTDIIGWSSEHRKSTPGYVTLNVHHTLFCKQTKRSPLKKPYPSLNTGVPDSKARRQPWQDG